MTTLTVNGMNCGSCVRKVTNAILELDPAAQCSVDLTDKSVQTNANGAVSRTLTALHLAKRPLPQRRFKP